MHLLCLTFFIYRYFIDWKNDVDSYFTIDATEGTIATNELLDRESTAQYNFSIIASKVSKYDTNWINILMWHFFQNVVLKQKYAVKSACITKKLFRKAQQIPFSQTHCKAVWCSSRSVQWEFSSSPHSGTVSSEAEKSFVGMKSSRPEETVQGPSCSHFCFYNVKYGQLSNRHSMCFLRM